MTCEEYLSNMKPGSGNGIYRGTTREGKKKVGNFIQIVSSYGVEMNPGDCINIPTEVKHWHGAAPDEWFSHLAIEVPGENSSNEWLEPVSDEEYRKLK